MSNKTGYNYYSELNRKLLKPSKELIYWMSSHHVESSNDKTMNFEPEMPASANMIMTMSSTNNNLYGYNI